MESRPKGIPTGDCSIPIRGSVYDICRVLVVPTIAMSGLGQIILASFATSSQ